MLEFAGVFFEVDADDADLLGAALAVDFDPAALAQGLLVLRDLVALGQVGIDVVFARKNAAGLDLAMEGHAGHNRQLDGAAVDHGQGTGLAGAHWTNVSVGRHLKVIGRAGTKHLGGGLQLDVDFHADNGFVVQGMLL